jgi:4-amino-4-deoxy-L-arabinose transferase-like glycosyltransferase
MIQRTGFRNSLLFGFLGAIFFIPFLGGVHLFDWDEINFAECTREMINMGDYLRVYINYAPFWEKPPFFFWLQAIAMKLFGVGEFAARFPNAICGVITLIVIYNIGEKLYNKKFGLIWALTYFGSVLPFLYFKSGIIDPYFNLFIFLEKGRLFKH